MHPNAESEASLLLRPMWANRPLRTMVDVV